ncbi:unnamed protein product, partial [Rotaria sp. Silwood2]
MKTLNKTKELTSKQIYEKVMIIFNQLKEYVHENPLQHRSLTIFTYQQAQKFQNELKKYYENEITENNQWLISVENFWTLLEAYQSVFSKTNADSIEQDLRHTIQSLEITNMTSRLSSLIYLKTIPSTYASRSMIEQYLRGDDINQTTKEIIDEFEIFFDFIKKSHCLLNLIIQYVTIKDENDLYYLTPMIIEHCQHIFHSILTVTEIINGRLYISTKISEDKFENFQKQLEKDLDEIKFPRNLIIRYGLDRFIVCLAPIFNENQSNPILTNDNKDQIRSNGFIIEDSKKIRRQAIQTTIDTSISKLTELLSRAGQLPLRPHNLIRRIHEILHKLKTFDIYHEHEDNINCLIAEETILINLFEKFQQEINHYTSF